MISFPIQVLIWNFFRFASAVPLKNFIDLENGNSGENVDAKAKMLDFFLPETAAIDNGFIPYKDRIHIPRPRREAEMEDLGLDNVSFEVPTIMKVNDTQVEDAQVNFLTHLGSRLPTSFNQGNLMQCSHQNLNPIPKQPITITMCIDNIIPPGKADKYVITNSSEIRGCGVVFKINICESKASRNPSDMMFSFDLSTPQSIKTDKLETQNKRKNDEEEDDGEPSEKKTLQDILRKILSSKYNSTTLPPEDLPALIRSPSKEPFTLILNTSMFHIPEAKYDAPTSHLPSTFNKSPNTTDYDYLCKVVEQLSSNIPRQKLASLLSGLIAKAYPEKR